MIREEDVMRAVRELEKTVENMRYPTKTEFLKAITKFKIDLAQPERFKIPDFLRRD